MKPKPPATVTAAELLARGFTLEPRPKSYWGSPFTQADYLVRGRCRVILRGADGIEVIAYEEVPGRTGEKARRHAIVDWDVHFRAGTPLALVHAAIIEALGPVDVVSTRKPLRRA